MTDAQEAQEERHLTADEQKVMTAALRRSSRSPDNGEEVERVATAIHDAFWLWTYGEEVGTARSVAAQTWSKESVREKYYAQARAAIAALSDSRWATPEEINAAKELIGADSAAVARTAISPADPAVIIAGIRQFGLAPDGSDLRDLQAAVARARAEAFEAAMQAIRDALNAIRARAQGGGA